MTNTASGSRARTFVCAAAAVLLAWLIVLSFASAASAHAELLSTSPEDGAVLEDQPDAVELVFNEQVSPIEGAIRLLGPDGQDAVLTARSVNTTVTIALPTGLPEGTYAVAYRVVSADGHPIAGVLTFSLGEPTQTQGPQAGAASDVTSEAIETWLKAVTALQYLGLLTLAGLLLFERLVAAPIRLEPRRVSRTRTAAAAAAIVGSLVLVPLSAARVAGAGITETSSWWPVVTAVWQPLATALLVLVLAAAAWLLAAGSVRSRWLATAAALAAATTPLLVGHTQSKDPTWLMMTADAVHLVAGSIWLGGLIGLLDLLRRRGAADPLRAADGVHRFSRLAAISVLGLSLSGITMAWLILDEVSALWSTGYGRALMIKLLMAGAVLGIAAWNRYRLLPRLCARQGSDQRWSQLRRLVAYEAALLVAVVAVTGALTNSSPSHEGHHGDAADSATATTPAETPLEATSQGLQLTGILSPTQAGQNTVQFTLIYDGEPVSPEEVTVQARHPEQGLGPIIAEVQLEADGSYSGVLVLPVPGRWELSVSARISTFDRPIIVTAVTIN